VSRTPLRVTSANQLPQTTKAGPSQWKVRIDSAGHDCLEEKAKPRRAWDLRKHVGQKGQRKVLQKDMRAPNLGITVTREPNDGRPSALSSPRTPHTPHSPFAPSFTEEQQGNSPVIQVPPRQPSPNANAKKSFFSNKGASRSTTKLPKSASPVKNSVNASPKPPGAMASVYNMKRAMGSSPELTVTDESGNNESESLMFSMFAIIHVLTLLTFRLFYLCRPRFSIPGGIQHGCSKQSEKETIEAQVHTIGPERISER